MRTTRNDFVLGTAAGIIFFTVGKDPRSNSLLIKTGHEALLRDKDITEVSEYAQDKFVVGLWNENDFLACDRSNPKAPPIVLKQPLWCNNLCTDLVPVPGYHPINFPYYFAKTLRSISLIDFRTMTVSTLLQTQDMPSDCYGYKKMTLTSARDGRLSLIFVTASADGQENTVVEEITFARFFIKALRVAA